MTWMTWVYSKSYQMLRLYRYRSIKSLLWEISLVVQNFKSSICARIRFKIWVRYSIFKSCQIWEYYGFLIIHALNMHTIDLTWSRCFPIYSNWTMQKSLMKKDSKHELWISTIYSPPLSLSNSNPLCKRSHHSWMFFNRTLLTRTKWLIHLVLLNNRVNPHSKGSQLKNSFLNRKSINNSNKFKHYLLNKLSNSNSNM